MNMLKFATWLLYIHACSGPLKATLLTSGVLLGSGRFPCAEEQCAEAPRASKVNQTQDLVERIQLKPDHTDFLPLRCVEVCVVFFVF